MGLVEKDTARLTEASREGSEERKRPTRKILVHEGEIQGSRVCCSGTKMAMRKKEERTRRTGPRNLRFHLVARACPSVLSSWLVNRGRGLRETRPPAGRAGPPQSPCRRRCTRTRSGAPRRCTRGPNPFPGERTSTAFSRYASRPR